MSRPQLTEWESRARDLVEAHNRSLGASHADALPVGVLTPLSGPGDPVAGELVVRGAVLGARYAGEHGGMPVRLLLENDQRGADVEHMSRSAVGGLAKLAFLDRVSAVVGQWHLRTTPTVIDMAEELGLPVFIENGHNTATHGRQQVFRTYFSIADRAPLMAGFAASRGWKKISVIAADTVFGQMLADTLCQELAATIPDVQLHRIDFAQDGVADLREELKQAAEFGPDLLLNVGVVRTNYMVIEGGREAGLLPGTPMMVCFPFPMRSADYWRLAGEAGAGVLWPATRFSPSWEGLTPIGRWFVDTYHQEFGSYPPDNTLNSFTDVTILAQAARAAGATDRAAVHKALCSATFDTWRGPVSFPWSPDTGHHQPPEIVLQHYRSVGDSADEAVIVWPPESVTGEYADPRAGR
jgi:branched-chain amino acid transport system substrate-binding protein